MFVTKHLQRFTKTEREKDQPLFLRPCSPPGFTEPTPLDVAGALLPHLCTLTLLIVHLSLIIYQFLPFNVQCSMFNEKAVFFCGTILTVACTGHYPASLIFRESGLSSVFVNSVTKNATTSPTHSISNLS